MVEVKKIRNLEIAVDYDNEVNYVATLNGREFCKSISVKNCGEKAVHNLVMTVEGFYFPAVSFEIPSIEAGGMELVKCEEIKPALDRLILLAEAVYTELSINISNKTRELAALRLPITIQAWNFWDGQLNAEAQIASFVMPNHEYVMELMEKASRILKEKNPGITLNGYHAATYEDFLEQISSIWTAIATEGLKYLTQNFNITENGQKIMTVDMIRRYRQGNCMDLSILLCSCLERLNISPVLVYTLGHVMVGVWVNHNEVLSNPVCSEQDYLTKCVFDKKGYSLIVLESTYLRFDHSTINDAYNAGMEMLRQNGIDFIVDIESARIAGVKPLPFATSPSDMQESKRYDIVGYKVASSGSVRQDGWERKLLDLTLRNPMLNLKKGKTIIELNTSDVKEIISTLESNRLVELINNPSKEDEDHLKDLYRAARSSIEESGANSLFVAIGTLQWYDMEDDTPHIAPLLFVPVSIVRKRAMCYEIRLRDDEPMVNVTLVEMMRQMFGVKFSELDSLPIDESGIPSWQNTFNVFNEHIAEINKHKTDKRFWQLSTKSYIGIFSFTKFLMWNDIHSHPTVILHHPLLKGLINNLYDKSMGQTPLDEFSENLMLPLDFDSSQLEAVIDAHRGNSFVLHGPPGTGKSQTITNMIADAIYNGKRVLFVAEKKAALDVVKSRLADIGLSPFCLELHSNKTDKRSFFSQLNNSIISTAGIGNLHPEPTGYDIKMSTYKKLTEILDEITKALHSRTSHELSVYDCICGFIEKKYEELTFNYDEISHFSPAEINMLCAELSSLDIVANLLGKHPGDSLLVGLYPKQNTIENQRQLSTVLMALPDSIIKARKKAIGWVNRWFIHKTADEILQKDFVWKQLETLAFISEKHLTDLDSIEESIERWKSAIEELRMWYYFSEKANVISSYKTPKVLDYYLNHHGGTETADAVKSGYYKSVVSYNIDNNEALRGFSGLLHEKKIDQYRMSAVEYQSVQSEKLITKLENNLRSSILTPNEKQQHSILQRRMLSNGRGVSLRKVIAESQKIIQKAFPCMLMSPLSVAQYLEMQQDLFDIVIFDEASQMETPDAIGTIARGNTIIVVGDPKQLPPTRFFTSQNTSGEEVEESEDADSILEDCITLGLPSHYLTRHYRSRHESLIAFSNNHFYENKLFTFPSHNDEEKKVRLIDPSGIYDMGKSRTNKIEAEAVVKYIMTLIEDNEKIPSLGVVAFSKAQSNLIEDLMNARLQRNKALQKKLDESPEPLFVKNLENVQGDERDIIIFSIGYGPDANGNVSLNFGPINQSGGERRLNVAVSRAREEMIIFTSLKPYHIPKGDTIAKGVALLRDFLLYADSGVCSNTNTPVAIQEDKLINDIASSLRKHGLRIKTNIGKSDYKIDIAVIDENNPQNYKLGIIVDSSNYKKLPTVRDRELVVPNVLANLGWNLHRIWVIDWLSNPEKVVSTILDKLSNNKKLWQTKHLTINIQ